MTIDTAEHPAEWHDLLNTYRQKGKDTPGLKVLLTVTFEERGGKTKLTILSRFDSVVDRDANLQMGAAEGWAQSLERLEAYLLRSGLRESHSS